MAFNVFATATSAIPLADLDANFTAIGTSAVASTLYPTATTSITYGAGATNHIFNTSGNVGIGTSSPTGRLFVKGSDSTNLINLSGATYGLRFGASASSSTIQGVDTTTTASYQPLEIAAGGQISFSTGSAGGGSITERMRIDSSGRVCIGGTTVTDSHLLNIQGSTAANNIGIVLNKTNATAQIWSITNTGPLAFYDYTASTERARIDLSGRFMIGTTTAGEGSAKLTVTGNSVVFNPNTDGASTHVFTTGAVDDGTYAIKNAGGSVKVYLKANGDSYFTGGNLLVGTTSQYASSKLCVTGSGAFNTGGVDGTYTPFINATYTDATTQFSSIAVSMSSISTSAGFRFLGGGAGGGTVQQKMMDMTRGQHIFYITDSEVARIDSSGNLLVGTTSSNNGGGICLTKSVNGSTIANFENSFGSGGQTLRTSMPAAANNTSSYHIVCNSGGDKLFVYGNGNVVNTNNSYGALSDSKLKENIVDASPKLANLMQIKVRNYNLIGETTKQIGVVAQELETIFPGMIDETPDYEDVTTTDEDGKETTERVLTGTKTKSVKYSVFVPMLIKAMQELKAEVDALKSQLNQGI